MKINPFWSHSFVKYLYFAIISLVRFAHSIRLFGEIKIFSSLDSIRRDLFSLNPHQEAFNVTITNLDFFDLQIEYNCHIFSVAYLVIFGPFWRSINVYLQSVSLFTKKKPLTNLLHLVKQVSFIVLVAVIRTSFRLIMLTIFPFS